ncbi:MAG: DUF1549 domain-containing protein [Verrucomicrobiae bacterium]|nr:DUF1549 domain-containing protein [Verrucomicrobiae bacterium]MCP5541448.1 DUF1549 domain-containing protein [Akkermansiaceae bacterium]MCP5551568.1 DUF1549 domain-containing protein [Akkermansiaceae bacterium]
MKSPSLLPFSAAALALVLGGFTADRAIANALDKKAPESPSIDLQAASKKIDQLIEKGYQEHGIQPNPSVDDATFLRRAYLDIAGRIPTIEEAEAFNGSNYENKRERLIEDLLQSEAYVSHFYNFWADVLRINSGLGNGASQAESAYQLWVKRALRDNMPYDEFVFDMVSAKGMIWENGASGYYMRDRGMPLDNMSNTVRIFLGTRLECAQCHNHPFDVWTQMDYYKMAAFSYGMDANRYDTPNRLALAKWQREEQDRKFSEATGMEGFPRIRGDKGVEKFLADKRSQKFLEQHQLTADQFREIAEKGEKAYESYNHEQQKARTAVNELYRQIRYISVGERERTLKLPHDYQYDDAKPFDAVEAGTMFGAEIDLSKIDDSTIDAYAKWLTAKDNPTFTKVVSNRLWKKVFGIGLFEPVDELTEQTQVSNPELLAYLEELMRGLNYDMKSYLQVLYNTKTYQRAANTGEVELGEPYFFAGPALRRMSAEQIWDSIVALALPEADQYRPRLKSQLGGIERVRQIYASLEERPEEEYVAMVQELGEALAENMPKQEEVRKLLYKARENEDEEAYQKYRQELRDLSNEANRFVRDIGYKLTGNEVDEDALLAALGMSEMRMGAADGSDAGADDNAVLINLPKPKLPEPPADLDKNQRKNWKNQQAQEYKVYASLVAQMARASELESPARRGHFLREFGQSDREVIENAASNASVPQALNLLNGPMVEALTNKFAVFGHRLHEAGDPAEKTRMIFQAMLTREPTPRELELVAAEVEKDGDAAYEGVVWALLNTQQFLFVQ